MKIRFDSNQQYQRDAMDTVLGLFDGQPPSSGVFDLPCPAQTLVGQMELDLALNLAST